ncbi:hypothetical protein HPB50_005527 [Hyalomma asiaticum]|uniref:Uncharacterized protein n=1 Tax=Hyalomma asiaticum TaxID=266040 RepID=A0ACB7TD37_HYAAI|nr:hypothetical protein HPB50_005527 [Hyalomma asiaticum]
MAAGGLSNQFGPHALRKLSCAHASAGTGHTARRPEMSPHHNDPLSAAPHRGPAVFPFHARHAKLQKRSWEQPLSGQNFNTDFREGDILQKMYVDPLRDRSLKPPCPVHC